MAGGHQLANIALLAGLFCHLNVVVACWNAGLDADAVTEQIS